MPLDETMLIDFSLGLLDPTERQDVERELAASPALQAELRAIEETLTGVALSVEPVRPSPDVRTRLFAALQPQTRFTSFVDRVAEFFDLGVERARELLDSISAVPNTPWEASPVPGTSLLHLDGGPRVAEAVNCGLVHIAAGSGFPRHRHIGDEWSLVLQGSSQEDNGHVSQPGDLLHKEADSEHAFRVISDEPLVFAVVLYGGIQIGQES